MFVRKNNSALVSLRLENTKKLRFRRKAKKTYNIIKSSLKQVKINLYHTYEHTKTLNSTSTEKETYALTNQKDFQTTVQPKSKESTPGLKIDSNFNHAYHVT